MLVPRSSIKDLGGVPHSKYRPERCLHEIIGKVLLRALPKVELILSLTSQQRVEVKGPSVNQVLHQVPANKIQFEYIAEVIQFSFHERRTGWVVSRLLIHTVVVRQPSR